MQEFVKSKIIKKAFKMAKIPNFPETFTLNSTQEFVNELKVLNNWKHSKDKIDAEFLLFIEECGELAKEIRRMKGGNIATNSDQTAALADEFADVLVYLNELANLCDVNLEEALKAKMTKNKEREWKKAQATA